MFLLVITSSTTKLTFPKPFSHGSYTDQYQTLRERIDELAEFIGANVLNLGYQSAAKLMTNPALRNAVADLTVNREKKKD